MKSEKGITLISLVITIVVLIILTSISLSVVIGENGIIKKTSESKLKVQIYDLRTKIGLYATNLRIQENEDKINISFSEKVNKIYENLQQEGLTQNTRRVGNLLIVEEKDVVFLTSGDTTTQADKEQWNYNIKEDGTATIYGYKGQDLNITIPTYVKENNIIYPINKLEQTWGDGKFYGNTNIKSVRILDNIEKVDTWIFADCKNLEKVILPESIDEITEGMFSQCKSLKSVNIPKSIKKISGRAFNFCVSLRDISIPSSVEEIGFCAFGYIGNRLPVYLGEDYEYGVLRKITLNEGLKIIGEEAFLNAMSVEYDLNIPSTVTQIGDKAFSNYGTINNKKVYRNGVEYVQE